MNKRRMIKLNCDNCGKQFEKPQSEFDRNEKLLRKNYCSRSCCGKDNIKKNLGEKRNIFTEHLNYYKYKDDEFIGFRDHLRRAKRRNHEVDIDLDYLKEIWNNQDGICPYSGIQLEKPKKGKNCRIKTASLDRIDSSKGYIKGNIQFVAMPINFMKNTLSHKDTIELCKTIANKWK